MQQPSALIATPDHAGSLERIRSKAFGIVGFALLTAAAAQIRVPIEPVPITLQTLAVTLAPFALGAGAGVAAMCLYALLGLSGLPFFADSSGATIGYILGFIACQPAIALVAGQGESRRAGYLRSALALVVGYAVIFGLGLAWLSVWLSVNDRPAGLMVVLEAGLFPFMIGMVLKSALAALIAPDLALWASRRSG